MRSVYFKKVPFLISLVLSCIVQEFVLPTRLSNLKATKATAQEIIDTGAKVNSLLRIGKGIYYT